MFDVDTIESRASTSQTMEDHSSFIAFPISKHSLQSDSAIFHATGDTLRIALRVNNTQDTVSNGESFTNLHESENECSGYFRERHGGYLCNCTRSAEVPTAYGTGSLVSVMIQEIVNEAMSMKYMVTL